MKKKGISWNDKDNQDSVVLQEIGARSEAWMLDRKASVGPCYRPGLPFEGPSGIMINLPKKSFKSANQPSGISINISRKCLVTKSKSNMDELKKSNEKLNTENINSPSGNNERNLTNCISNIREKLCKVHSKIRGVFQ